MGQLIDRGFDEYGGYNATPMISESSEFKCMTLSRIQSTGSLQRDQWRSATNESVKPLPRIIGFFVAKLKATPT